MRRELAAGLSLAIAVALGVPGGTTAAGAVPGAMPMSATDPSVVPHYFGPYPNWANSPQVLADAVVDLSGGGGTGALATASVDPKTGGVTAITVTDPGSGYISPPTVAITSPGVTPTALAAASATVSIGAVTSIAVDEAGFGFVAPQVTITGGNPTTPATAVASGGVDNLAVTNGGTGYTVQPIVSFSLPDLGGTDFPTASATLNAAGVVDSITLLTPGSGYTKAPTVTILDGTSVNPTGATVDATIGIAAIDVTAGGEGYDAVPAVAVNDTVGVADKGASATATMAVKGAITGVTVTAAGAGYLTPGLKKFVDTLPGLGPTQANDLGQYIPVAVPDTTTYPGTDYYEIAVVQYRQKFHRDLPATLLRGYVQLSTTAVPGKQVALTNANLDSAGPDTPIVGYAGVDNPHYLGPTIVAEKDRPVRILFRNLLPTGVAGDLFLPVDTSLMGAGAGPNAMQLDANGVPVDMAMDEGAVTDGVRNPMCGDAIKPTSCYSENRATLHLHGGITPWISDGTPHQWTTPSGESTDYPQGVSVSNVPDMPDPGPGAETFFYTNQQSARLMFYHDHAWGITRLNVYAGEAAGYLLTDKMEQDLISPTGALAGLSVGTPLVVQDKTFVSNDISKTDPTWNSARWGGTGSLWTPHVYMPAQNPSSATGVNPFGRWMYGPWFWPPAKNAKYPPIANPYYDPSCDPDVAPFCEPAEIPSTPNVSVGMEAFNDTPIVNGTAYPTTTVDPKAYRYRILNAANDRFWNLQWYVADPTTGTLSEVALKQSEVDAAQTDPNVFPTPDTVKSPAGPNWIQIGTEGGFLPAPAVIPAQPITWITDPTRFDVGNVDKHSLLLAPAERADVIVDFSQYRGKTLILYNDAPAAFPARVSSYDYYTGGPDLSPVGAPTTLAGFGPNTRTIMQVKVSLAAPAIAFDRPNRTDDRMGALNAAFAHHLDANNKPAGVFEAGSDPVVVGQAAYNTAYGTSFVSTGYCSAPTNPTAKCDGFARIQQQGGDGFKFDTLNGAQLTIPLQPKAIHDEMNSASFDEWGRMTANLGLEAPGATPINQNIILYPYVNPATEALDASGLPSSLHVTPISSAADGTQIWKITHNGVDTHPIHWHLYDVQVLNRVTWDNIIMPPDANELGWKDTVRVSPLEDTYVAVRPIVPTLPFGVPESVRPLNPMMPLGARGDLNGTINGQEAGFNNTDTAGNPLATPIVNTMTNFGWEYVYHCHILSHEEMDMMRPVTVHVPTAVPDAPVLSFARGSVDLHWTDGTPVVYTDPSTWGGPQSEIGYHVERADVVNGVAGDFTPLGDALANSVAYTDNPPDPTQTYDYRVTAWNAAGASPSNVVRVLGLPKAPTALAANVVLDPTQTAGARVDVSWVDNATDATSVVVERAVGAGAFTVLQTLPPSATSIQDTTVVPGTYQYRVKAVNSVGDSAYAGPVSATVVQPASRTTLTSSLNPSFFGQSVTLTATVDAVAATGIPSGSVTFTVDGVDTVVPIVAGSASLSTTTLSSGTHAITATYAGDAVFASSSDSLTQTVLGILTTTTVTSNRVPSSTYGQSVTFTAAVVPSTGPAVPTGTVQFRIDGVDFGLPVALNALGRATLTTTTLSAGSHGIVAVYSGSGVHVTSTSAPYSQVVIKATPTLTITSNRTTGVYGRSVTFTARVQPTGATGTVRFRVDGVAVGSPVTLDATGRAAFVSTTLSVGTHQVSFTYSGNGNFNAATSGNRTYTVSKASSLAVVRTSGSPAARGTRVTFTATVTAVAPGSGAPGGTVRFFVDGVVRATVTLNASGVATWATTTLAVGRHTVSVAYAGDTRFVGTTSQTITQRIR